MIIESKDNKHFKEFKKLTSADGVRKYGRIIVSGRKLIKEITQSAAHSCVALIIYERYADDDAEINTIIKSFSDAGLLYILKKHLYNELDSFNTSAPLLVIRVPEIPEWDFSLAEGCNLLIPFQDPLNVGAVIRSAAGFGVKKIIMLKEAAHLFHPRSIKASAGAVLNYSNLP
jgi:tRNA G18 (ribose-2'-O)-methylase SpoU